ncbi:type IV secretory system conjugative DNA transfer family protein [Amycolatopsis sp. FDAARGOS 1241]|uniref:type IV secretory system conjugative DNA transfer family protein n=1 Tax=Amycolatopsis sp. FDAARGOS 1241 TaxID=2778070 RepID=UPI00194FE171|nr:type IV secretory system conjugative DNA transfer family protein [Amycolatopsis sp. FDAARGOS 1241]QRP48865.1 type IV secretory system conjugative DNA transfer family protein [Amycolatopsis sp. FDAARGOS 1241]
MRTFKAFLISAVLIASGVLASEWHVKVAAIWPWLVTVGVAAGVLGLAELMKGNAARVVTVAAGLVGLSLWFLGWVPAETPGYGVWPWGLILGSPVLLVAAFLGVRGRGGSRGLIGRWSRRSRRNGGVASRWQIWRVASKHAMRRKAKVLKPSLRKEMWWTRRQTPVLQYATPIARVGRQRIWSPVEDVTLRFGGPRSGKTGELACRILDAPGAVIATSTRTDLIDLTSKLREQRNGPTFVFNPSALGKLESTITFDPLTGCENPVTATHRAADMLPADGGDSEREHWIAQARRALATLMHAAALGELTMSDVAAWVADPAESADEVLRLLRRSPEASFEAAAQQFLTTNDRTRSSITTTIMPALAWLTDPNAKAAATGGAFDVAELLDSRATVYMLGAEEGHTAPLLAALTSHLAREARRIASESLGGRLDPALTLVLDEAALVAPVPLDKWTADMGGRNVTIHMGAQSRAQLRQRWGDTGCAAIMTNSATVLILAGARDGDDLQAYSLLTADRHEMVESEDADGHITGRTPQRVPVLSPGQIAQLPELHAVVVRRGMPAAIGQLQMAWKRGDVKAVERRERWDEFSGRWEQRRDEWAVRFAAFVDLLADKVEPWLARLEDWHAARKAAKANVAIPAQDHTEPVLAKVVRLDVADSAPVVVRRGDAPEEEPLAVLDAELEAEAGEWTETGADATDERGEQR